MTNSKHSLNQKTCINIESERGHSDAKLTRTDSVQGLRRYTLTRMYRLVVVAVCLGVCLGYIVPVKKLSVWGDRKDRRMKGVCTFDLNQKSGIGDIEIDLLLDKKTFGIEIYNMNVETKLDDGKIYELSSKYELHPPILNVEFILKYKGGKKKYPRGICLSNLPEPVTTPVPTTTTTSPPTPTTTITSTTAVTTTPPPPKPSNTSTSSISIQNTNVVPIFVESHWPDKETQDLKMTGVCKFNISKEMKKFYIQIDVDKDTYGLVTWIVNETDSDPDGRWYYTKNIWPEYPQEINFRFHLNYFSNPPPVGTCRLDKKKNLIVPTAPPPPPPTTTEAPLAGNTVPIFVESNWPDHETPDLKMTGVCKFNITKSIKFFRIRIDVDKDTYKLVTWIVTETDADPSGLWYDTKNIWPEYPPEINFRFHLNYYSNPPPKGTCTLDTSGVPPPPVKSTTTMKTTGPVTTSTLAPPTAAPSTASPPTAAPSTASPSTAVPSTASPSTSAPSTASPSTAAPSTASPSTAAPSTASPSTPAPSTASPSTPAPSTASPSTPAPSPSPTSLPALNTKYDYSELLHKSILFYEAQRSGKLPANNRIPYRGDSAMGDKGENNEDLTGGWYDAGDGVKFNLPMAGATTILTLGLYLWEDAYDRAGELENMYNSIKWPLDYFMKCWREESEVYYAQVGNGDKDHAYWGRHEEMTMDRPAYEVDSNNGGSDVAGEAAAAMAAGAMAFETRDPAYAQMLLGKAKSLYAFAKKYQKKYTDTVYDAQKFYSSSGYKDELCESAIILHMATNEQSYLDDAEMFFEDKVAWAFSWDDKAVLCQTLLYDVTGKDKYKSRVEQFITSYMPGGSVTQTSCGLAWRDQWGSLRYSANAAFIAVLAADFGFAKAEKYKEWAMSQIHYMVGDNNQKISYVIGFGNKYPLKPHHRASSCPDQPATCSWDQFYSAGPNPQILEGALVGGPDSSDNYLDNRQDYIMNEVTCDYNSGFQSAVAGLLHFAVNQDLPQPPTMPCV